ncbi:hypothetical protein G7Y89_g4274 [Cudoniella acicularis]|uniref:Major facilitator superfamily (MFS) profile domain-containing protein n=1 Tax=Cudoniella acicularis TaxID=354080 RepID=A0A8H4RPT6_9HELO|nr:hypothetical protein G7Y89_g4274 [Cudoniella acicularis]
MENSTHSDGTASSTSPEDTIQLDDAMSKHDVENQLGQDNSGFETSPSEKAPNDPNIVDWDGPDDAENPMNWLASKKITAQAIVSLVTTLSPLTLGPGTIADMVPREKRGMAMTTWILGPLIGPMFGLLEVGCYLAQVKGWLGLHACLLQYSCKSHTPMFSCNGKPSAEEGDWEPVPQSALDTGKNPKELFRFSLVRPLKILFLKASNESNRIESNRTILGKSSTNSRSSIRFVVRIKERLNSRKLFSGRLVIQNNIPEFGPKITRLRIAIRIRLKFANAREHE